jgi:hypothetical protein
MPLDFLLRLIAISTPITRGLEAARAAAPFLHSKLSSVDPKPTEAASAVSSTKVVFAHPKTKPDAGIEDFED